MFKTGIKSWRALFGLETPPAFYLPDSLQWFFFSRLCLLFAILIGSSIQAVVSKTSIPEPSQVWANGLVSLGFLVTFLQAVFFRSLPPVWTVPILNFIVDVGLASAWMYFSVRSESIIALLFLIYILAVSLSFYQKGALIAAGLGILCFALVGFSREVTGGENWAAWAIYSVIFVAVGLVGGYLSEELLRTTERLKAESARIEKLTALHEMILDNMPTGLVAVDTEGRVNFVNPAGEHILDTEEKKVVGRSLAESVPSLLPFFSRIETGEWERQGQEELATIDTASHRSVFLKTAGEKYRLQQTVESQGKILRGDVAKVEGSFSQLFGSGSGGKILLFQDVTKVVHLEDRLKQHEKLAAVGQLAAGIAHEIRNPLASMSASIQLLKGSIPEKQLSAENHKLMDIVIREIDRLNELISEFLDYVKPENFKKSLFELEPMMAEVVQAIQASKEYQQKVELKTAFAPGVVVFGNPEKLRQVLWNLVVNAIQAVNTKGTVEIGCSRCSEREQGKFWVEDSGVGMSDEVLRHLYEPFFTTKPKGTGLGLATVYRIVEAHQGEIQVKSTPQVGTCFEVFLPVRETRG